MFVLAVLNKILKKISNNSPKSLKPYLECDNSSYLNSSFRFDVKTIKFNRKFVSVGKKCLINAEFIFERECGFVKIGDNVHIGGAKFICIDSIEIYDDVTMAWGITIYDHNSHSIYWDQRKNDNMQCYEDYILFNGNSTVKKNWSVVKHAPIVIKSKVWIGFDVTILKGVTIGEGAVVGAKSVVTRNVEPWTVVAGNPAKIVKYLPGHTKGIL